MSRRQSMSRKPSFSLAYSHDMFGSMVAQAFAAPPGIPAAMRAILDQLDTDQPSDWTLAERLDAIRALTKAESGR